MSLRIRKPTWRRDGSPPPAVPGEEPAARPEEQRTPEVTPEVTGAPATAETRNADPSGEADPHAERAAHQTPIAAPAARTFRWPGKVSRTRLLAYGILPFLAIALTAAAGYVKWQYSTVQAAQAAGSEAVQAASDTAVALLSYGPETVDQDLADAQQRLTGTFADDYSKLISSFVIPTAKQEKVTTVTKVQAAALVSSTVDNAVVLLSVDQTITMGAGTPTSSAWSVRATLDKVGDRWLVSAFDPV